MRTSVFPEKDYNRHMDGEVAVFRRDHLKHTYLTGRDGLRLHALYALHPDAKAAILLVHGLSEFAERYLEMLYYFYEEGFSVFMPDHRGHGRSGRRVPEPDHIFVKDFAEYVSDLEVVAEELVRAQEPDKPLLLFGHSMGGCISALFLERHPDLFRAAVLSSPMLGINFGQTPLWQVRALAAVSKVLQWNNRSMGKEGFNAHPSFEESAGISRARFERQLKMRTRHRAYQTENVTFSWARAALKATDLLMEHAGDADLPILICQAGNDTLVDNEAQNRFADLAPRTEIVRFPEARHEIFHSTEDILAEYYQTIFDFYEKHLR